MAKLYFRYGTMDSAKTMNLLAVAHNYRQQGKRVALLKPRLDDRFGSTVIASRSGLEKTVDLLLEDDTVLDPPFFADLDCVLVDEAQFLSPRIIEQLRALTRTQNVPVICYGLRTDFQTRLFEGARRLFELADSIEEIKVTCQYCNRKAIFNMRLVDGVPTAEGETIQLGGNESYAPTCHVCYVERLPGAVSGAPEGPRSRG
jgi:thymidine kinase